MKRVALLMAAALLTAGCGDDDSGQTAAPVTSPTLPPAATAPPPTQTTEDGKPDRAPKRRTTVYMLRGEKVVPVARAIGLTAGPGGAALRALLRGPTDTERAAGIETAIVGTTELGSLDIKGNRATVDFSRPLPDPGVAQVVHTLTEFATVTEVRIRVQGRPAGPVWDRRDLENFAPQILITYPLRGDVVKSPLTISGTANTFEATFKVQVLDSDGKKLVEQVVTATSGSGTRGRFDATLQFAAPTRGRQLTLYAFEPSAEDGRPLHEVRVPLIAG